MLVTPTHLPHAERLTKKKLERERTKSEPLDKNRAFNPDQESSKGHSASPVSGPRALSEQQVQEVVAQAGELMLMADQADLEMPKKLKHIEEAISMLREPAMHDQNAHEYLNMLRERRSDWLQNLFRNANVDKKDARKFENAINKYKNV